MSKILSRCQSMASSSSIQPEVSFTGSAVVLSSAKACEISRGLGNLLEVVMRVLNRMLSLNVGLGLRLQRGETEGIIESRRQITLFSSVVRDSDTFGEDLYRECGSSDDKNS